jgi:hypothetical protein
VGRSLLSLGTVCLLYEGPNNPRKNAQTGQKTNAQGQLFRGRIRSHRYKEGMERQYKHRKITGPHEESKSSEFHEAKNNTGRTNKTPTTEARPVPQAYGPCPFEIGSGVVQHGIPVPTPIVADSPSNQMNSVGGKFAVVNTRFRACQGCLS